MNAPEIMFYTNNLRADYIVTEFTLKFDTGLGWRHAVSASLNLMPDGVTVKSRWPLTCRGGRFSNCPDGVSNAPAADLWVKARFLEFLAQRGDLGRRLLPERALLAMEREVNDPATHRAACESRDGWSSLEDAPTEHRARTMQEAVHTKRRHDEPRRRQMAWDD